MQVFNSKAKDLYIIKKGKLLLMAIVAAIFVFNDFRLISASYEKDSPPPFLIFLAYTLGFISLVLLLLARNKAVRTIMQILLFSAIYTDTLYLILSGFPFSFPDAINLFNNPEYAPGAFATFGLAFLVAFVLAGIVYSIVSFLFRRPGTLFNSKWLLLFIGIHVCLFFLTKPYPGISDFLPSVYRVSGNLLHANRFRPELQWRRTSVNEQPGLRRSEHVFLIVDESVTGTSLSINGFFLPTTPFLKAHAKSFINFGIANSFTNFSAGSNHSLLSGLMLKEMPDKNYHSFSKPGIFQYAKKAGYRTFLLDAQAIIKLQNYTTSHDRLYIDSLFQVGTVYPALPTYSRDSVIAAKLVSIAKSAIPTFVYVNKIGSHWPYQTNFPGEELNHLFRDNKKYIKPHELNYLKSIYWNVDRFWKLLFSPLQNDSSLLILYTADHGEAYQAPAFKIKHASIYNADRVEGIVPLLAFDKAGLFPQKLIPYANGYSHEYIFPTLLYAFGYDKGFINKQYGSTLLEPPNPARRWFLTGDLFGRGKNNRINIDTEKTFKH